MDPETAQNPETSTERTSKKDRINRDAFTGKAPKENWAELAEQEPLPEPEEYVPPVQSQTTETSKFEIPSRSTGRGGSRKGAIERNTFHGRQGGKPGDRKDQVQARDVQSRSVTGYEVQLSGIPSSATAEQIKGYIKTFDIEIVGEPRLPGSRTKFQTMSAYVDVKDKQNYTKALELKAWEFTEGGPMVKFTVPKSPAENVSRAPRDERAQGYQQSSFFGSSQRDQQHQQSHNHHHHHQQQQKPQPEKPLEPEVTVARPEELRIKILPRGATAAAAAAASSPTEEKPKTVKPDPFGGAKPRDESEYNRKKQEEEEKKKQQEAEEKAAQAAPEAETQAKAEEADAQVAPAATEEAEAAAAAAAATTTTEADAAVPVASEAASPSGKTHKPATTTRSSDFNQAIRAPSDSEWVRGAAPEPKPAEPKQRQPFQKGHTQQGDKKKPSSTGAKSAAFDAPVLPKPSTKKTVIKKPESTKVDLRSTNIFDAFNTADSDEE